jgi:hypothetical protein
MIFRRLAQNLREQNWTAIAIEFVLLVLGVFLGIQVANWNESRRGHALEAEYLVRLERDFRAIEARLQANVTHSTGASQAATRLLGDLESLRGGGAWPRPKATMLQDLDDVQGWRIPAPRAASFVELLSTGNVGLLRETRLRDALLDYDTQVGYTEAAFDILVRRVEPYRGTFVAHFQFNRELPRADYAAALSGQAVAQWTDVDLEGLAADPALTLALNELANAALNQSLLAERQQQLARAVLAVLDSGSDGATP